MVRATIGKEHFRTELVVSGKTIIADEPLDLGGTDLGPAPGEYLMISLAACTAITLRMYSDRKQWPVDEINVEVATEKLEKVTRFQREIILTGNLTTDQREKLLQIANACPVHKMLVNPIQVDTRLV